MCDTMENFLTDLWRNFITDLWRNFIAAIVVITIAYFWKQHATNDEQQLSQHWTDEDLFKEPPPNEECSICMLPLPANLHEQKYQACCGKVICCGCSYAVQQAGDNQGLCPFCRTPPSTSDGKLIERMKKRAEGDDAEAIYNLGCLYRDGRYGLRQNKGKAVKLWLRAGEFGHTTSYCNVGYAYGNGRGVEKDKKKAKHYYELAAMGGSVTARHNLGAIEGNAGNMNRAMKHFMISAAAGHDESLKEIQRCYLDGHASKDDFEKALRAHFDAKNEMKSDQRKAATTY